MNNVFLGLGSNVGDSIEKVKNTVKAINEIPECNVIVTSSLYETSPYGNLNQNNFINCVVEIETEFNPGELVKVVKTIEHKLGRKKREHWGPREVDIDILLFNDLQIDSALLTIPHPDLTNRDFVLVPLLEIDDSLIHPVSKKLLRDYLDTNLENHILNRLN